MDNTLSYFANGQIISVNLQSGESLPVVNNLDPECKIVKSGQTESRHTTDSIFYQCGSKTTLVINLDTPDFFTVSDDQDQFVSIRVVQGLSTGVFGKILHIFCQKTLFSNCIITDFRM